MLALLAAVIIGTFVFLFQKSRPEVVRWQELEATVMDIRKTTVVTGKIEPRNEVDIKPQINGIISEIYKEAGEQVEENEVIAKLKVIPDMSSLSSAESRVRLADINLNQAQTDYEREKLLYDKDLVSAEEYDQVLQALNQAKEEGRRAGGAGSHPRWSLLVQRDRKFDARAFHHHGPHSRRAGEGRQFRDTGQHHERRNHRGDRRRHVGPDFRRQHR